MFMMVPTGMIILGIVDLIIGEPADWPFADCVLIFLGVFIWVLIIAGATGALK